MSWFMTALKKYAVFSGRARRKEYWMFILFYLIFGIIVSIVDGFLASVIGFPLLSSLYSLAMILPALAVLVRRLHDIGKSGWWVFISLIPVVGSIWLLVLVCLEGSRGPNEYGEDPKTGIQ